jgi:hypothetical protein
MAATGKLSGKSILESIRDGTAMISKILSSRNSDLSVLKKGACRVGEVEVKGIEVLNSSSDEVSCTPKLIIGGTSKGLNNSQVTYSGAITPVLT